jgi:hypothetical protein
MSLVVEIPSRCSFQMQQRNIACLQCGDMTTLPPCKWWQRLCTLVSLSPQYEARNRHVSVYVTSSHPLRPAHLNDDDRQRLLQMVPSQYSPGYVNWNNRIYLPSIYLCILQRVEPLLRNDREMSGYTRAISGQRLGKYDQTRTQQ